MIRVQDRRRHERTVLICPVALKSKSGRILFRGRSADVSPVGIRIMGPPMAPLEEEDEIWVEMRVPTPKSTGPRYHAVKLRGTVRRVTDVGDWRSVIVVIFETDFSPSFLRPVV